MFTQGYIKKHRTCLEWRWRKDPLVVALWDFILLSTNFKPANFENLTIQRGQFVTSLNTLSFETGISIRSVRTALKKLESSGELTIKTTSKFSILTIANYDTYQGSDSDDDTQRDKRPTRKRQATDKRPTLIEERKEEEEGKESIHAHSDLEKIPVKLPNGESSKHILLTKIEKEKVVERYHEELGDIFYKDYLLQAIDKLEGYLNNNGKKKYKDFYRVLIDWPLRDAKKQLKEDTQFKRELNK